MEQECPCVIVAQARQGWAWHLPKHPRVASEQAGATSHLQHTENVYVYVHVTNTTGTD